jgi:hypothetical protein
VNSSRSVNLFVNPFYTWSRLAWKAGEMAMAATQVIGHRARRFALTGPIPSAYIQREFTLMGQEKGEAALESARAVGARMLMLNQQFAAFAFKQMLSATAALMSIAASRTTAESLNRQSKLVRDTVLQSTVAASKLSGSTALLAGRALKPVHTRVKGNARRLGRKSR